MTAIQMIIRSKAIWTALFSFLGLVLMRYLQVDPEIWQSFVLFALSVVGIFAIDDGAKVVGIWIARGIRGEPEE